MTSTLASEPQRYLVAQIRWRPVEIVFWLATLAPFVLTPNYLVLASQIAITALPAGLSAPPWPKRSRRPWKLSQAPAHSRFDPMVKGCSR